MKVSCIDFVFNMCVYVLYFQSSTILKCKRKHSMKMSCIDFVFNICVCMYYTYRIVLYLSVKENIL